MARVIGVLLFWASTFIALNSYFPDIVGTKESALGKHMRMGYFCPNPDNTECYLDRETIAKVQGVEDLGDGEAKAIVKYQVPLISLQEFAYSDSDALLNRRLEYTDVFVTYTLQKTRVGWFVLNDVMQSDHKAFSSAFSNGQLKTYRAIAGFDLLVHRLNVRFIQFFNLDSSNDILIAWLIVFGVTVFYYWLAFKGKKVDSEIVTFSVILTILSVAPWAIDRLLFF